MIGVGVRVLHLRSVHAARRQYTPQGGSRADRRQQVRARCGAWVLPADAVREDQPGVAIACVECARMRRRS